jgi:probable rRNA maturation factor
MEVLIDNQQKDPIPSAKLKKTAMAILNALDCPEGELSLLIVDDDKMAVLNQRYRGRPGPTNVLAFSMNEGDFAEVAPHLLGDVVISVDTCRREAQAAGVRFENHFTALLVHGILHLFGYDHEQSEAAEHRMAARSQEILAQLATITP